MNNSQRKFFGAILVLLAILGFTVEALAQNPYNPQYATLLEISGGASQSNPTGAITIAIGLPQDQSPPCTMYMCPRAIVSMTPVFAPTVVGCGMSPTAIANAIAAGVNGAGAGYTASNPAPNRELIVGPTIPSQNGFWVGVFHNEIHQSYGYVVEPARPVTNLCDNVFGNEDAPATGAGVNIGMVTIPDPAVGSFESLVGPVVPPNWIWDGVGTVSVEGAPQNGFPTSGYTFLRLSTQDPSANGNPLKLATTFNYVSATPVLRIDYRWICGEPGPTITQNDSFDISIGEISILKEDTFTTVPAGTRTVTVDLREAFWYYYLVDGAQMGLSFNLSNGGANVNDSVVLVDNIAFLPPQLGEGNNNYTAFGGNWFLSVSTQDPYHYPYYGTWDKTLASGGSMTCYFSPTSYVPLGATVPFLLAASITSYGTPLVGSLPGEPGIIGIDLASFSILHVGAWYPSYPPLTFFVPPQLTFTGVEGLYLQGAVVEPATPNGLRITNLVRLRLY